MKLLVDIGNTRTKYIKDDEIQVSNQVVINNTLIDEYWLNENWKDATNIIISLVKTGKLQCLISNWCVLNKISVSFIESEKEKYGVTNCYESPEKLGVDRWLALIGAANKYPNKGLIVVDAGTATTIDLLDENGNHQGGYILAGIDLLLNHLNDNTSKVKFERVEKTNINLGHNTSECVNNAAWAATLGLINQTIMNTSSIFNIECCVLLGGNAHKLAQWVNHKQVIIDEMLIFDGLKQY